MFRANGCQARRGGTAPWASNDNSICWVPLSKRRISASEGNEPTEMLDIHSELRHKDCLRARDGLDLADRSVLAGNFLHPMRAGSGTILTCL